MEDGAETEQLNAPKDTARLLEWAKKQADQSLIQLAQDGLLSRRDEVSAELDVHIATPGRSDLSLQAWGLWQETGAINEMLRQIDFKAQPMEAEKTTPRKPNSEPRGTNPLLSASASPCASTSG
jgi:hypothetical protein